MASGNCFYELEARLANREGRAKRLARLKSQNFGIEPEKTAEPEKAFEPEKIAHVSPVIGAKADEEPSEPKAEQSGKGQIDSARIGRELDELKKIVSQTPDLAFIGERISSATPENTSVAGILGYYRIITSALKNLGGGSRESQPAKPAESKRIMEMEMLLSQKEKDVFMFRESLAVANKKLAESEQRCDKMKADFDNYKGRTMQDVRSKVARVAEEMMKKILPVIDNFERAYNASKTSGDHAALETGIAMTLEQFENALKTMGITKIDALHKPFDPMVHEALMTEPNSNYAEDTVIEVLANGYMMNGKLLRAASVKVSK